MIKEFLICLVLAWILWTASGLVSVNVNESAVIEQRAELENLTGWDIPEGCRLVCDGGQP